MTTRRQTRNQGACRVSMTQSSCRSICFGVLRCPCIWIWIWDPIPIDSGTPSHSTCGYTVEELVLVEALLYTANGTTGGTARSVSMSTDVLLLASHCAQYYSTTYCTGIHCQQATEPSGGLLWFVWVAGPRLISPGSTRPRRRMRAIDRMSVVASQPWRVGGPARCKSTM